MKKILVEFLVIAGLLLATWYGLSKIDWIRIFKIEQVTTDMEAKIGDLLWASLNRSETEITSDSVRIPIQKIGDRICSKNNIERSKIKFHILENNEINAFALPDNHIVLYSGLIKACENERELSGVICHELAHLERGHVMHKLVKEIGLSVLISMSTGNGNGEIIKKSIKQLSSTAYDRKLENEADETGVDIMLHANIDPAPMANFLERLSREDLSDQLYWISTHPGSRERAVKIRAIIQGKSLVNISIMDESQWEALQVALQVQE